MKEDRLERICQMVRSLREEAGPTAGYDPVMALIDRRKKKQKNYPKEYVQMYRDIQKGNRLKSVMK